MVAVSEKDIYKLIIHNKAFKLSTLLPHLKQAFPRKTTNFNDEEKRLIRNTIKKFARAKAKIVQNRHRVDYERILEEAKESTLFECDSDDVGPGKHWSQLDHKQKVEISKASNIENMIADLAEKEQISPQEYLHFLMTRFKS